MSKNNHRRCAKCGQTRSDDMTISYFRFPKPGIYNITKAQAWAKYCWPAKDWTSMEALFSVYHSNKVLCARHFTTSKFSDLERQKLHTYSVPDVVEEHDLPINQKSDQIENNTEDLIKCRTVSGEIKLKPDTGPHKVDCQVLSESEIDETETGEYLTIPLSDDAIIIEVTTSSYENETHSNKDQVAFNVQGLCPPVFTPLNKDYSINYGVIKQYAQFLVDKGIKAVLVGGTTGEHMSLSVSDRKKVIDEWVITGKPLGLHIMVQVGGAPLADVLDLAVYCSKVNVDSLLTLPELYFKPQSVSELVSYVEIVANAVPNMPVLYYNIPSMSKVEINMPAFVKEATARIPNFKGLKFTSNDLSEGAQVLRSLQVGQEMFLGADTLLAPGALLGIRSSIGTTYNIFPQLAKDILDAMDKADIETARVLQEKLSVAVEAHTVEGPWVPVMKASMELVTGINVGPPALPLRPISDEAKERIASKLRTLKLLR